VAPEPEDRGGRAASLEEAADRAVIPAPFRFVLWALDPGVNPGSVIYGLMTVGAVIAVEAGNARGPLRDVLAVASTALIYFLIHAYSTLLGHRLRTGAVLSRPALVLALGEESAILRGALLPAVAMVAAWLAGADEAAMSWAGMVTAIVVLVLFELLAGLRSHLGRGGIALQALIGVAFGFVLVALKALAA
jgi:hypothetical protein